MIEMVENLKVGKVVKNQQMKDYTTYKTGGNVRYVVHPSQISELITLLAFIRENNIKYKIIGNGSNLIFTDDDYEGVIIRLDEMGKFSIKGDFVTVGAGYSLMRLALKLSLSGYTGFEFASGIPGTVGGAIFMNAGAYKSDMSQVTKTVKVLTKDLMVKEMGEEELDFSYRSSYFKKNPEVIILEATFHIEKGDAKESLALISERKQRRMESQPLEYPSAGSVFRNPEGDFAGRLIEEAGLKGKKIGGAMVSMKHANFIINTGGATSKDIEELIKEVKKEVKEKFNVELKEEQEYVRGL